jgi:hypothetical protein
LDSEELYTKLKAFFPQRIDLMRHLDINSCWEYIITEKSINEPDVKLNYYLVKKNKDKLEMTKIKPEIIPDLILFFTEKAIINMIEGNPSAEEYYTRYKNIMNNPQPEIEVDNKINKARLKLWQIGYKKWQKEFKF